MKDGYYMKKRNILFVLMIVVLMSFGVFVAKNKNTVDVLSEQKVYLEGNEEEVGKMYIEVSEGSLKNQYTENNPLILTVNEEIIFHMAFSEEDYPNVKNVATSGVFAIGEGNIPSNVMVKVMNDQWYDEFRGIRFSFKPVAVGDCKVVIYNSNSNEVYETLYVRVMPSNQIRYRDDLLNKNVDNPSDVTVDTEKLIHFEAVLLGPLVMNGDVPSEENFRGSGFWSWDVPVTNVWKKLENNKWLVTYEIDTIGEGNFTIGLGRNGAGNLGSVAVHVVQNKIEVNKVKIGTYVYDHINKNVATRMFNGFNKGDNNPYNRYVIYIGEDITVNANVEEGYSFDLANSNTLDVKIESSYRNGVVSATFRGMHPGDNEILLRNGAGDITERFYVQVRYPFYVNTNNGEIGKDFIHEYLDVALADFYNSHPDAVVSNPDGVPQYVKNGFDYYMFYYLFNGNTVELSTYISADDDRDYEIEGNIEMLNHTIEDVTSGSKAGMKKITAEFKVIVENSGGLVRIGEDTFIIAERNGTDKVHHFDLEIEDGGTLRKIEKINYTDGYTIEKETLYSTRVFDIHGGNVYDADGNTILEISENEFWLTFPEGSTQFETTSAYLTNAEGHLIDGTGRIIDDLFRGGLVRPLLVDRNLDLKDVDKVDFDIDLLLVPVSRTVREYKKTDDGELELINSKEQEVDASDTERFNDYVITMNERQVVDAFNKCPYHSGFDFTFKLSIVDETDIDENYLGNSISSLSEGDDLPKNPVTSVGFKLLIVLFTMSLISLVILIVIKNNKRKILFSSK